MNQNLDLTLADVLGDCPTGVGILTDGRNFEYDPITKIGSSGWWKLNADRVLKTVGVAVCVREKKSNRNATIYVGAITGIETDEVGRAKVIFTGHRIIDAENVVWTEFAGGSNPVRYYPGRTTPNERL